MEITWEATIGSRAREYLRPGGKGIFLGVFSSSFYCRIEGKGVLLFHKASYGTIPFGVGCDDLESLMAILRPVSDEAVLCRDLELFIPSTDIRLILRPHIPHYTSGYECTGEALLSKQEISRNIVQAEAILGRRKESVLEEIFCLLGAASGNCPGRRPPRVGDLWNIAPLDMLLRSLCLGDCASVELALNRLIGLGTGLTPTMDDVLTGLAYIFSFLERNGRQGLPSAGLFLGLISGGCHKRTSEISGAYLLSAARGEMFSILEDAAISLLLAGDDHGLARKVESLLAIGSDSGGNMLAGMLLGVIIYCDSVNMIHSVSK